VKKKFNAVIVLLLTTGLYGPVVAEENTAAVTLDEIVVTATKTEESVRNVANSVILKDSLDIDESPAISVGELLANAPGIDWRTYGNYGGASQEIHIRGMGGKGTQVFFNGLNINSPSLGVADVGRLPLNSIDRVEVVKGSGSLLYGTGAMGGTVNIITKSPEREQIDLRIKAGFGEQYSYELAAENGMFFTENFGYYLTATNRETDGFRDNSDLDHNDVSIKLLYDNPELFEISLFTAYIDRDYGSPGVKPPAETQTYFLNGRAMYNSDSASLVNEGSDEDWHNILEFTASPLETLKLSMRTDYSDIENYFYDYPVGYTGSKTWVTNEATGFEGFTEWEPMTDFTLLIGGQYRDYDYENKQKSLDNFGNTVPGTDSKINEGVFTKSGYVEAQYRPHKYIKLQAGIRHEHHSTFGYEDLPHFGLVLNPFDTTVIKASHGKHFRAPHLNDLYWPDTGYTIGNTNLDPETGWHSDITLEQALCQNKIMVTASYFKVDIDDKIDWAEDPSMPDILGWGFYYRPTNLYSFESEGMELGVTITPTAASLLHFSYTYTDAEEEKTEGIWRDATNIPKNTFKTEVGYNWDFGLFAKIVARYVDERPAHYTSTTDTRPDYIMDSYWTTDIKITQNFMENWLFSLNANNIFDKGYETYTMNYFDITSFTSSIEGYPGSGRSVFASLAYEF